jgi:hypothetical protein
MSPDSRPLCYNCGLRQATTRDHVIPKTLIPDPKPSDLPTLPACAECNQSFSRDEEYLRDRLAAVVGDPSYEGREMWNKAWRSMQHPKAKGKKIGLFRDVIELGVSFHTREGVTSKGIRLNKKRVNRVVEKMMRGFYYHLFGERLQGVNFQIDFLSSVNPRRNVKKLSEVLDRVLNSPTWMKTFGPQTWVACGIAVEDNRAGIWVFGFFGGHILLVIAAPSDYWEKYRSG